MVSGLVRMSRVLNAPRLYDPLTNHLGIIRFLEGRVKIGPDLILYDFGGYLSITTQN